MLFLGTVRIGVLMRTENHICKFLSRIESGNLCSITQHLLQKPALIPTLVWTVNLSHIRGVSTDPRAFEFLESNSLILADGWPVKYLARTLELREVSRVPGVDLVDALLRSGVKFSVIGSDRGQVAKTIKSYNSGSSELMFVYDKYIDLNSETQIDEIIQLLFEYKPQFIFLALGFPKQEMLFERIRDKNPFIPAYFLGIGGSFQMLSGEKVRAPRIIQGLGLEWFWRLAQDPKRLFKRYFSDCKYLLFVIIRSKVRIARNALGKWS